MKVNVVRIKFLDENREFFVPAGGITLAKGDIVVVETPDGLDCCRVVEPPDRCVPMEMEGATVRILRKATPTDIEWLASLKETEEKARDYCEGLTKKHGLDMRIAGVKAAFDNTKLVFFFVADKRVDFRELVKELAREFKTRIEMRQIGVRDNARRVGGIGVCGRILCCATFLGEFAPITMRMAKDQNLTLSPSKISGTCGRLLCCLSYEDDTYRELRRKFPAVGSKVQTELGTASVVSVQYLPGTVTVALDSGGEVKVKLKDLSVLAGPADVAEDLTDEEMPPDTE